MSTRFKPARIEYVVDADRLRAQLGASALDHIGDPAAVRARAKDLLHGALFRGRSVVKQRLEEGENGFQAARLLARVMNVVIQELHGFAVDHVFRSHNRTAGERFAVVAVGGYGRGELAPSSDIDLLFLRGYKQTPWAESVTEYMLYMLWDMSLKVGNSSRTVEECLRLARGDHTIHTALLDMRLICGDESLFDELKTRYRAEVVDRMHSEFMAAKLKERDERHVRAGESRYMVEPNIKEGKGGLRDLHTLFWLAKHRYGYEKGLDYVRNGVFSREEAQTIRRALEFLWTVRCHLHFVTGRAEERLSFDLQPEIATRLGYGRRKKQQAVERFMRHYFLTAKEVGMLTRSLCAKLGVYQASSPTQGLSRLIANVRREPPLDVPGFKIEAGRVDVEAPAVLDEPINLLRLFEIADTRGLDVHPTLFTEIDKRLRLITPEVRRDPEAIRAFLNAATSKRDPARTLRLMNEAGVLGRFVPEFGRIVAQMQFNMYHHFTVDEHTLRAIEFISEIENGKLGEDHPLATEIFPKIINRRALYLAMMLHDSGKGIGDQQIAGAEAARAACTRLGLPAEEVELVAWLVRHHLEMSDVAQKRDLGDPNTVAQFAQLAGSIERLRLLLVLTVADIRAVGPGVWNGWKAQLLRDLFSLTEAALRGGRTDVAAVQERLAAQAQETRGRLVDALGALPARRLQTWLDSLEDAYWIGFDFDALLWHAQEMDAALQANRAVHAAARPRARHGATEVLVLAPDRPGLFASLAAALASSGANIADARVTTTVDGKAFDVFSVQTVEGAPFGAADPHALEGLLKRLERAAVENAAAPAPAKPSRRAAAFAIEPWVRIDNEFTPSATVVEVSARDRPGLLAALALLFAEAGVSIVSAHIHTYGERAADVFYVQDASGGQVGSPRQIAWLRENLIELLKQGEPDAPADPARQPLAVAHASTAR
ncbi:MAG: [protein-PII] uridylyltransferase [Hyphomonadaceae bacterium]|nr:[protein-PII] uridylyltransferase [Hyphomonadaceae bacterium]